MGNKQLFQVLSGIALVISVGLVVLIVFWFMDFILPLGLMAIVLGLAALWLQGEGK